MKATDLMIGDWVALREMPELHMKVRAILSNGYIEVQVYEGHPEFSTMALPPERILPIPLTPEILEKNGFNKPQDAGDGTLICGTTIVPYRLTFQSVFGLPILTIENVVDNDNNHTCLVLKDEIYNVHELQHALKLCGIDKEIVL